MTEQTDTPPIPEITIEHLRRSLAAQLQTVRRSGAQRIVLRRGRPLAGLVTVAEARAVWRIAQEREGYAEWRMTRRLDEERQLRMAVMQQVEAERRAEYARRLLGR